ncbi:hypothetical protein K0B90_06855 [bacterium]|nr:hypothetical protein [bacterium]
MAVDDDTNLEVGRVTATGTSGSPKTFSITVPTGRNYRFFVMENEGTANSRVYPMYIGTNNVFGLDNTANGQVISLGMVSPDLTTGRFAPANHPALMMGQGATSMIPPSLAGSAFSMDNVIGTTWSYNTMMTSGEMGWAHGTMEFVSGIAGITAGITSITTNIGPGTNENFAFSMDANGIMTETTGDTSFHGVMSMDKSMIVATRTNGENPELWVMMNGTAGTTADMTGGWVMHSVSSGNPGSRDWTYGHSVVDAGGTSTFTGMMGSGGPVDDAEMTFMMNGGVMTMDGSGGGMMGGGMMGGGMMGGGVVPSTFHGIMSGAKNLMVSTYTDGAGGYPFSIQVK